MVPVAVMVPPLKPVPAVMLVTVPVPGADAAMVIDPGAFVIVTLEPAVNVVRVNPVPLPMSNTPFAGVVVSPVPPKETGTGVIRLIVPESVIGPPVSPVPVAIETLLARPAIADVVVRLVVPF